MGMCEERMRATWHVLGDYGNMFSVSVHFLLDELMKWTAAEGKTTTSEALNWAVLLGFGPGLTVEVIVLHSKPIA